MLRDRIGPRKEEATTYLYRFRHALSLLCGGVWPDSDMCVAWLKHESEKLQDWAASNSPQWAMGIGTIEAAICMADNPTEGGVYADGTGKHEFEFAQWGYGHAP